MRRGYAHAVAGEADLEAQIRAITAFGCDELLVERETCPQARARLDEYLYNLPPGSELVAVRLEVFARSTGKLVTILADLIDRGVSVTVLEPSRLHLTPDGAWAELLERLALHEEVRMHQRYRGGGSAPNVRRRRLDPRRTALAVERFQAGDSIAAIARALEVEPRIVSHALSGVRKRGQSPVGGVMRTRRTSLSEQPGFEITRPGRPPQEPWE